MNKEQILKSINEFKVDIWSNPNRPRDVQENHCEYCGKKCGKNPLWVHINTEGTILPNTVSETDLDLVGMQSQGCFPIGRGCAKNLFGNKLELYTLELIK